MLTTAVTTAVAATTITASHLSACVERVERFHREQEIKIEFLLLLSFPNFIVENHAKTWREDEEREREKNTQKSEIIILNHVL